VHHDQTWCGIGLASYAVYTRAAGRCDGNHSPSAMPKLYLGKKIRVDGVISYKTVFFLHSYRHENVIPRKFFDNIISHTGIRCGSFISTVTVCAKHRCLFDFVATFAVLSLHLTVCTEGAVPLATFIVNRMFLELLKAYLFTSVGYRI